MIEVHQKNPLFLDEDKTLPLIIDFSFTPGDAEIKMLEEAVEYRHQWTLKGIDALAGRVPVVTSLKHLNSWRCHART